MCNNCDASPKSVLSVEATDFIGTSPDGVHIVCERRLFRPSKWPQRSGPSFVVIEARDADDADAYLKSGRPVDLIFSDIHLPGSMDGLELARQIRDERPHLPVVLTSGRMTQAEIGPAILLLPKPYELHNAVALMLSALTFHRIDNGARQDGILIVESDLLVRRPLAEYLRECGYRVLEATDALRLSCC